MARYLQDDVAIADRGLNSTLNDPAEAMSAENRATEEAALSDDDLNIVAKVIFAVGDYVKVKWFWNGKPLAIFKSRDYDQAEALAFLEEVKNDYDVWNTLGVDTIDSIAASIDDATLAPAATGQMTVESTVGEEDAVDVTEDATYWSDDTAVATVDAAGEVTAVAAATKATGTLTSTGTAPANDDTVTIGAKTYTYKTELTDPAEANEILIGASAAASLDNLKSAVNATAGAGTTYGTGTTINATVAATTNTDTTQVFEAKTAGTGGNALATTETSSQLSFGAATLTGGTAGTATITAEYRDESDEVEVTVDV